MKVFISHSSTDKKFVRTLKEDLKENGIATWVDEDELNIGDRLIDKLETALKESTHFLIVLSPSAVNSPWVKYELDRVLNGNKTEAIKKILPIKYQECELPDELSKLLHFDLSNVTRTIKGDKVAFEDIYYHNLVTRLCKTIRKLDTKLSEADKKNLTNEIGRAQKPNHSVQNDIIRISLEVVGYKNKESRLSYSNKIIKLSKKHNVSDLNILKPILLPPIFKTVFANIALGTAIIFTNNYEISSMGHFAGFRKDDLAITIDSRIRNETKIEKGCRYIVEIEVKKIRFNFLNE